MVFVKRHNYAEILILLNFTTDRAIGSKTAYLCKNLKFYFLLMLVVAYTCLYGLVEKSRKIVNDKRLKYTLGENEKGTPLRSAFFDYNSLLISRKVAMS